jgi:hypothetical protein
MAKRLNSRIPRTKARESDDRRKIYAILREEFTAVDLQRYTVEEPGIPLKDVIATMEKVQRKSLHK